jgi:hypothetical protein
VVRLGRGGDRETLQNVCPLRAANWVAELISVRARGTRMQAAPGVAKAPTVPEVAGYGNDGAGVDHHQVSGDHSTNDGNVLGGADDTAGSTKHGYLSEDNE